MPYYSEEQLQAMFKDYSIERNGEFYLDITSSQDFVSACSGNNFAILGIEGVEIIEQSINPRLDLIADFSTNLMNDWQEF